jgi:YD repeat-containing protein
MLKRTFNPAPFAQHAGFRACARVLFLALLAGPWAGRAEAFPAQPTWAGRNPFGNCLFEGDPPRCLVRDTKAEIFTAIEALETAGTCGWATDWFQNSGTFPDEVWQRNSIFPGTDFSCDPPNTIFAFLALQNGAASLKCPENSTPTGGQCTCNAPFLEANNACGGGENNGVCDQCKGQPAIGNPANPANGNKFEQQPVYRGLNGFELVLAFNTFDDYPARYGRRWRDSFDRSVSVDGSNAVTFRQDGKAFRFVPAGGAWVGEADTNDRLTELKDALGARTGWQLYVAAGDETEFYDASGRLLSIRSRSGLAQTLTYSDGTGGPNGGFILDVNGQPTTVALQSGLLIRAVDSFARILAFGYDASSRVRKVTDPQGGVYQFIYDANGNLGSIAFPDAGVRGFLYNEPANTGGAALPNALTGITDENGARFATFQYDAQERAVSTEHAGGAQRYTLTYGAGGSTTVTDPLGTPRTYGFNIVLGAFKNAGIVGPACPSCGPAAQSFDANGNVASRTDWNGNVTLYGYDLARNLETSRSEAFGTAQARTITTQWHPGFRLPVRVAEPLRTTSYVYNGDGVSCGVMGDGATLVPGVLCAKTIQPTSDATGAAGFGATPVGSPRTWRYTHNANGSVLTVDGPRTDVADVTAYAYYANDDADPGRRGNLAAFANALGHTTQILAYNAHGQPLTIVDPNGLGTALTYDSRQRLTSRSVGGELTIYSYDGVGQLTRVTLPDASFVAYGYDAAHRLTLVGDNLGNRIAYTLDAMGNRVAEQVLDPGGALAQTRSRVYDGLNRLFQDIGAQAQTTQYAYDNQSNLTGVTDPLGHATVNAYDALNRLIRVTDPGNGQTQYAYNGIDQLVAVSDPRNLATTYNYDGLANLNAQSSPDTGATVNTYDAAGNLLTQTDAKGQPTSYTYDALNRVTSIAFADGSKQSYGYDQGSNGLGRLTFFAETNSQNQIAILHDYAYDAHGRAITENRTMNGVTYAIHYGYDAVGRLSGVTYPSGRTVAYSFDALGRVSQVSTTPASGGAAQVVVSNVTYQPFGGVKGYTLGNGQSYTRSYDTDGRIASYGFGSQVFTLGYDAAGRIVSIADRANQANSNTYGYDSLDRLTSALRATTSFGYNYDAVGNRTSKTAGSATDTYSYSPTSNRIVSVAGATSRSFAFDANGSTLGDGPNQYGYDARGRMVQSSNATSGTTAYQVNALGQRVRKTNFAEDRIFLYDMRGRLIAETSPTGALLREYLYLNDIPIAVIQ